MNDEWQLIETAPKDGTHIILLIESAAVEGWWDAPFGASRPYWNVASLSSHGCGCCGGENDPPTRWMPLPGEP